MEMDRVKFYSEDDLACNWELDKVIEKINDYSIEKDWVIEDVIEFLNIMKYMKVDRFANYFQEKTNIICKDYIEKIRAKTGKYISNNKSSIISKYDGNNIFETEDFLEIIGSYKVYKEVSGSEFQKFIDQDNVPLHMILKHKKIVEHFDDIIKDKIISDSYNTSKIFGRQKLKLASFIN